MEVVDVLFGMMLVVVAGVMVVRAEVEEGGDEAESEIDPASWGKIVFPAPESDGVLARLQAA